MESVYVIVENGEPYPNAFTEYSLAVNVVKQKYKDWEEDEENEIDVPEGNGLGRKPNKYADKTELYIEKEIYITIYKLPVMSALRGGRTKKYRKNKTRKTRKNI